MCQGQDDPSKKHPRPAQSADKNEEREQPKRLFSSRNESVPGGSTLGL
jgi:hypothetical protein